MAPSLYTGEIEITPPLSNADMVGYEARLEHRSALRWHAVETPAGRPFAFTRHAVAVTGPAEASEGERILDDIQVLVDAFPDRAFTGCIQKTPAPQGHAAGSRIVVLDRRVVEIPGGPVRGRPEPGPGASGVLGQAARVLDDAGFRERAVSEYGSVVACGWRVEGSNRDGWARVEHKMPEPDLGDPDRLSSDAMYLTRLHWRDAYAAALTHAGFEVEAKTVMGNRSILLARPRRSTVTASAADSAGGRIFPLGRRLAAVIEAGRHPATGQAIVPGAMCGSCANWFVKGQAVGKPRSKCGLAKTRRGGPNLPAATPACALYQPAGSAAPDTPAAQGTICP